MTTRNTEIRSAALLVMAGLTLAGCAGEGAGGPAQAATKCMACHSFTENGPKLSGPNLAHIVGRPAASATDYAYSKALKNSGIVWTEDKLDAFIAAPAQVVPGTRMSFGGEQNPAQRKAIIAFIKGGSVK